MYLFLESIDHTCVGLFLDSLFCSITHSLSFRQYHTVLISVAFSKLCNQVARALQFCSVSNLATLPFHIHFKITCHFLTTTACVRFFLEERSVTGFNIKQAPELWPFSEPLLYMGIPQGGETGSIS